MRTTEPDAGAQPDVGVRLDVPARPTATRAVVRRVGDALRYAGWPDGDRADVMLAVDEAVQNAVEHGSAPDAPVEVSVEAAPTTARIVVCDRGRPGAPTPEGPPRPPRISDVRGRGRVIMASLADEVRWRPRDGGTEVVLRFRRDPGASRPEAVDPREATTRSA